MATAPHSSTNAQSSVTCLVRCAAQRPLTPAPLPREGVLPQGGRKDSGFRRAFQHLASCGPLCLLLIAGAMRAQMPAGTPVHDVNAKWLTDHGTLVHNVKAYGAKGDGVTDDTAAFIAATPTAGKVYVPPGNYKITRTWIIPRSVSVEGASDNASIITYVGSSAAIAVGDGAGTILYPRGAMHDLRIVGTGTGGSTIGFLVGGDPAGVITPSTYLADEYSFYNVSVMGFHWGLEFGNNEWLIGFFNSAFTANAIGIYTPATARNCGENISFHGGVVANNLANAMQFDNFTELHFFGTSFDYNSGPIKGNYLVLEFYGCHFEQNSGAFIDNTGTTDTARVKIIGGQALWAATTGNNAAYFTIADSGATGAYFYLSGIQFGSQGATATQIVNFTATGGDRSLWIENLPSYWGLSYLTPLINPSATGNITLLPNMYGIIDQIGTFWSPGRVGVGKVPGANAQLDVAKAIVSGGYSVTFSSTPTFDASLGNTLGITLTGNVTSSTLSNATNGEVINFMICQDSGGGHTFAWPTNVKGGMTIGSTASTCSAQSFYFNGTTAYALSPGVANM